MQVGAQTKFKNNVTAAGSLHEPPVWYPIVQRFSVANRICWINYAYETVGQLGLIQFSTKY